jgi:hypothetical protein
MIDRKLLLPMGALVLLALAASPSFSQNAASVTWTCTVADSVKPSAILGAVTADTVSGSNFFIRDYTGANNGPLGVTNMRWWPGNGVSWGSETGPVDNRYIQFSLTPTAGNSFTASGVSLWSAGGGTGSMRALFYASTDPTFATKTKVGDTISLPHATNAGPAQFINAFNLTATSGQTLYFRIYPWYTGAASTSKYVYTQLVAITGTTSSSTSVDEPKSSERPIAFALGQNYPNPFNPTTAIKYQLPIASRVRLRVYNLLGVEVATLVNGMQETGTHIITWNAIGMPSGMYFYKIEAGSFTRTLKMVLQK